MMPDTGPIPYSAARLAALVDDARLFAAELARFAACEAADAELDPGRRLDQRRRIVDDGFLWRRQDWSAAEIELLYGMAKEAARIALARRTAAFRTRYGIALTCGDAPPAGDPAGPVVTGAISPATEKVA